MLFDREKKRDKLTLLTNDSDKKINWERKCTINLQFSSFIGCHGEGFSLQNVFLAKQMFAVEFTDKSENILEVRTSPVFCSRAFQRLNDFCICNPALFNRIMLTLH